MLTNLDRQITSKEEAKAYLRELATNNEDYHPDDSADTIIWDGVAPDTNECVKMDALMDACREFLDPCEELLALTHRDKEYFVRDKSGRGFTCTSSGYDIYFDFSEETDDDDASIQEYLNESEVGDKFVNNSLEIIRTK